MGELEPQDKPSALSKVRAVLLGARPHTTEHDRFNFTYQCVKCKKRMLVPIYSLPGGTRISSFALLQYDWRKRSEQVRAQCKHCGHSWNVFVPSESTAGASPSTFMVRQVVETRRTEELIGDELRKIDNSATSTSSLRRLKETRRWAKKSEVQVERASTTAGGFELALQDLARYKASVEAAVKRNYAIGAEEEETFEEEIEITVPPHTMVQLRLRWKRLWQEGYVVLKKERAERTVNIPFRTVIGVTFDQESVDA